MSTGVSPRARATGPRERGLAGTARSDDAVRVTPALADPFGRLALEAPGPPVEETRRGTGDQALDRFPSFERVEAARQQRTSFISTLSVDDPGRLDALEQTFRGLLPMLATPALLAAAREKNQQLLLESLDPDARHALASSLLATREELAGRIERAHPDDTGLPAVPGLRWAPGTAAATATVAQVDPFDRAELWGTYLRPRRVGARRSRGRPDPQHQPPPPRVFPTVEPGGGVEGPVRGQREAPAQTARVRRRTRAAWPPTVGGAIDALWTVSLGEAQAVQDLSAEAELATSPLVARTAALFYVGPFMGAFDPKNGLVLDTPVGTCLKIEAMTPHPAGIYWLHRGLARGMSASLGSGRVAWAPRLDVELSWGQDRTAFDGWIDALADEGLGVAVVVSPSYWHRRSLAAVAKELSLTAARAATPLLGPVARAALGAKAGRLEQLAARSVDFLISGEAVAGVERLGDITARDVVGILLNAIPGYGLVARAQDVGERTLAIARIAGLALHGARNPDGDVNAAARLLARELVELAGDVLIGRGVRAAKKLGTAAVTKALERRGRRGTSPEAAPRDGPGTATAAGGKPRGARGGGAEASGGRPSQAQRGTQRTSTASKSTASSSKATAGKGGGRPTNQAAEATQELRRAGYEKLDDRVAAAQAELAQARARTREYQEARKKAGRSLKGGPIKGIWNLKERIWLLRRQKAYPNRIILEQARIVGVRNPNGELKKTTEIAGKGRTLDFVEIQGSQVIAGDLKAAAEIKASVAGGVKNPQSTVGGFSAKSKIGGQHAVESQVLAEARKVDGTIVVEGKDVLTGATVRREVKPSDYTRRVISYDDMGGN